MDTLCDAILIRLVGVALGSFLAAITVWTAAQWVGQREVKLRQAYGATFIVCIILLGIEISYLSVTALSGSGDTVISMVRISLAPVGLCILLGVIGWRFSVGFGRALLITLLSMFIGAVIVLIGTLLGTGVVWILRYLQDYTML